MSTVTTGIHHVTAIADEPQRNVDFYVGMLGLRMVKKTVNFDDPETYHLYYGDGDGSPGSIMTFFPWAHAPAGLQGTGQLTVTSFSIPESSLGYWTDRLIDHGIRFEKLSQRFDDTVVSFTDPEGMKLELITSASDDRNPWEDGTVPAEQAVLGFHHVTLSERDPERTTKLMTETLGFRQVEESDGRHRFEAGEGGPGNLMDVVDGSNDSRGRMGVGTVHHVAFRAENDEHQLEIREEIAELGYDVTSVLDRNYFHSIYFREPGGVLFEIATDPPGFDVDENPKELGTSLKLPPQYESRRNHLESMLPQLRVPSGAGE
ncbi:ring-cleaving dioxygenase [soil metagenome]|jgi:glyoxalase family protein